MFVMSRNAVCVWSINLASIGFALLKKEITTPP